GVDVDADDVSHDKGALGVGADLVVQHLVPRRADVCDLDRGMKGPVVSGDDVVLDGVVGGELGDQHAPPLVAQDQCAAGLVVADEVVGHGVLEGINPLQGDAVALVAGEHVVGDQVVRASVDEDTVAGVGQGQGTGGVGADQVGEDLVPGGG